MRSAPKHSSLFSLIRHLGPLVAVTFALSVGEASAAEEPQGEGAARKSTSSETYVAIDPIYSTILDGAKPRGLLMVELGLDVPDAKLRNNVNLALPVLRDAYVRDLVAYASTAVRPYRQPNIEDIANRLQKITDKVMGKPGVKVLMAQTAIRVTR